MACCSSPSFVLLVVDNPECAHVGMSMKGTRNFGHVRSKSGKREKEMLICLFSVAISKGFDEAKL